MIIINDITNVTNLDKNKLHLTDIEIKMILESEIPYWLKSKIRLQLS